MQKNNTCQQPQVYDYSAMQNGTTTAVPCTKDDEHSELTINTTRLELMSSLVVDVGVVQHSLGGDTTDVQAGTTKRTALFDTSNLRHTE